MAVRGAFGCVGGAGAGLGWCACWGSGVDGRLGNGTETPAAIPVAVSGGLSFDALATDGAGTCGIAAGAAYCWGYGGMLGFDGPAPDTCSGGATPCAKTPLAVSGGLVFRPVVTNDGNVACSLVADGQAYCWGTGYLGTGTVGASSRRLRNAARPCSFFAAASRRSFASAVADAEGRGSDALFARSAS